ncbi:Transferrin-like 1 [Homarus americanus]|uniref:Transferrin-like 1 n=1 Tax=Homarus americanus TaxID=6706 RepID=A0A8J5MV55_HOMAM|nr:Transferrin-like 1 [Homarus americanus]
MSTDRKSQVRQVLLGVSEVFKGGAPGSETFKLFGSYQGKSDLLFKNTAVGLKALSEDTPDERKMKRDYFSKLNELHSCEVRVCALEGEMADCEAMVKVMNEVGQQFVCVSARDRLDCVQRVVRGQVDMTPLPGSYLSVNSNLRIIASARDPKFSQEDYRYKAVVVVRRSTVSRLVDLRGKKSCHTGYGRTTGWRIPVALLKRAGVISPLCTLHKSEMEHEIEAVATTFNRACAPGEWATSAAVDQALKDRFGAMCSLCKGGTCDSNDDYAGYEGALRCLTQNDGDIAFSKINVVQQFFTDNRAADVNDYGLIEAKVQKLFWALSQAKRKARMNIVEAERMCIAEKTVRFCVTSEEESKKCNDLSAMLKLRGISPDLECVLGKDTNNCVRMISQDLADVVTLNDAQRFRANQEYNLIDLLAEHYSFNENNLQYLVAVIKKDSGITKSSDLTGKTTCHIAHNSSLSGFIDYSLTNCLSGTSDFFHTYAEAFSCLVGSNKDVAFVKHSVSGDGDITGEITNAYLNPENFRLVCAQGVVTRQTDSSARQEDMRHVLLKAAYYFGKSDSFFKLFFDYYSEHDLLFRDDTRKLVPVAHDNYQNFLTEMWQHACNLYDHHLKVHGTQ